MSVIKLKKCTIFTAQDGLASHWPEELTNEHVPKDWLLFKNAVPPAPPPQCLVSCINSN